jgi:putative DNA primase/helicase
LVKDGDHAVLVTCFGGCDRRDVIDVLRRRSLLETQERSKASARWPNRDTYTHNPDSEALKIWRGASPAAGSIIESYLRGRGITLPVPPSIRCGTRLHLDRYELPAMVAVVQRPDGKIVAAQTTLLTAAGKKAPVATPRISTGALGAGAVRLAKATEVLGIAEGVETALSAMQLTGVPAWACLGAARMHRVEFPADVRELHIFADNDEPGRAAAERTAHANRHRRVVVHFAPDGANDWNDVLLAGARAAA